MIDNIATAGSGPVYPTRPVNRTAPVTPATPPADTSIPDTPPAEVLHALDTAQQVLADLQSRNVDIRFAMDDGHVRTQLVDNKGEIIQEIPASHGLDILAGRPLVDHKA
jgi:hypothetical protein